MALRVLIVPDKFKGTLTARVAAASIAQGWAEVRPSDRLELLPMSDGGDGFGEVLADLFPSEVHLTPTCDAAHRPCDARWWWAAQTRTAVIESARVVGLALLPPRMFHPFDLDTSGLAAPLQAAARLVHKPAVGAPALPGGQVLVGIGGSATNDGGFGLARAIGWRFISTSGAPIAQWTRLTDLAHIEPPPDLVGLAEIRVAVDVQNRLLGPTGASRVYGPQKGLRPEDFPLAEACLGRLADVAKVDLGSDAADEPGSGAAGGLGFGLRCFLNARLESGFSLFATSARLQERIGRSDLVITGEGAIDASTLMGKGVGEIATLCRKHAVPCLGLAGALAPALMGDAAALEFTRLYGIVPQLTSAEAAMREPANWLRRLAAAAARDWA